MAKKLYQVIGVDENSDAHTITRAYRKLALKYHPDKQVGETDAKKKEAAQNFEELSRAYSILNDETKRKQYDTGLINDKGEDVGPAQEAPRPQAKRRTNQPHPSYQPSSQPFSQSSAPFFRPQPAHYFFFNTSEAARSFRPEYVKGPHYVYVTTSPLQSLFEVINASLGQNHKPTLSRSKHTSHVAANGDSSTYHQKVDAHPEHVSVKTNYAPRIERILDNLIRQMILLELLETLSQPYTPERRNDAEPTAGF